MFISESLNYSKLLDESKPGLEPLVSPDIESLDAEDQ